MSEIATGYRAAGCGRLTRRLRRARHVLSAEGGGPAKTMRRTAGAVRRIVLSRDGPVYQVCSSRLCIERSNPRPVMMGEIISQSAATAMTM